MTSYQYVQLQYAKRELTYLAVLPAIVGYILYLMANQQGLKVAAKVNSVYQSENKQHYHCINKIVSDINDRVYLTLSTLRGSPLTSKIVLGGKGLTGTQFLAFHVVKDYIIIWLITLLLKKKS